jgi:dolichol-phosphate mannosyltransferase
LRLKRNVKSGDYRNESSPHGIVILPTYCEAESVVSLIQTIKNLGSNLDVLVIDDSSPDGTAEKVKKLQESYPNVLLLSRPSKDGLGTAITDGFRFILSRPNPPQYIVTMDADYSHDPQDIPRLLRLAQEGSDVVIGSRYCKGGEVKGWNLTRHVISSVANKITAALIALPINDFTSGFRCYSRKYVQRVLPELHSQTYEIQIETLRQASVHSAKVSEAPIVFTNRKKGKSKLTKSEIIGFLLYVLKVAFRK